MSESSGSIPPQLTPELLTQYAGQVLAIDKRTGAVLAHAESLDELVRSMAVEHPGVEYRTFCCPGADTVRAAESSKELRCAWLTSFPAPLAMPPSRNSTLTHWDTADIYPALFCQVGSTELNFSKSLSYSFSFQQIASPEDSPVTERA